MTLVRPRAEPPARVARGEPHTTILAGCQWTLFGAKPLGDAAVRTELELIRGANEGRTSDARSRGRDQGPPPPTLTHTPPLPTHIPPPPVEASAGAKGSMAGGRGRRGRTSTAMQPEGRVQAPRSRDLS